MSFTHAAVWLDHHHAHMLQLDATQTLDHQIRQRIHFTRHHDSQVRSVPWYFGDIAGALRIVNILVIGPALEHVTEHEVIRLTPEHFDQEIPAAPRFA